MRILLVLGREKRGVSNVVAYVLLIAIAVALSVLVYNWLRFYVGEEDVDECLDGVGIIIKDYHCFESTEEAGRLMITLKNKGRFTIDGYSLRVHDRPGAEFGFYTLDEVGAPIAPGEEYDAVYYFDGDYNLPDGKVLETLTLVEVQPFMMEGGNISCKSYAYQELVCS